MSKTTARALSSAVIMTMLRNASAKKSSIAANAMGFAASWLTQWYAYDRRVLEAIGLLPHEKMAGFVHIGRAKSAIEDRARPDMAAIVSRFDA